MNKTVIGLFDGADQARLAIKELKSEGLSDSQTFGGAGGSSSKNIEGQLTAAGVPREEADVYASGIKSGGTLVLVRTDDNKAPRAVEIMERHSTPGAGAERGSMTKGQAMPGSESPGRMAGNHIKEEIVEEQINIGKRQVERPGAHLSTKISERPVEEKVQLHEEEVHVERRKANRPASEADLRGGDKDILIKEHSEEPVVEKSARVVGEVVVSKESHDRTATVRDTVRRKDVHVDKEPGNSAAPGYSSLESDFRQHHQKHDKSGMEYVDAAPAYRYGLDVADSKRFKGKEWKGVKNDVRADWEKYNPGTWGEAEPAIEFGWEKGHRRK